MNYSLVWDDDLSWFRQTREALFKKWVDGCRRIAGQSRIGECGELFSDVVDVSKGHVSIACALIDEQNQITHLIKSTSLDDNPILFLRFLLFLLDEFTERICESYLLLGARKPKQPKNISIWANHYSKHKLCLLVQHHVRHVFEDAHKPMYDSLQNKGSGGPQSGYCLRSGFLPENINILDEKWLTTNLTPDIVSANQEAVPAILIPSFQSFVDSALSHYEQFVLFARTKPIELARFQSEFHHPITRDIEREIIALYGLGFRENLVWRIYHLYSWLKSRKWFNC